ncbi:hypothetical protein [Halobaculum halobium]|uniref:SPW repeat-containing protein n=1 Tax=Halobaculum halobium TaxID=3032281 RepID=A0ABD5T7S3_9EURY|nr:hypothetical protein [Halobaculum sp. SYNS20]
MIGVSHISLGISEDFYIVLEGAIPQIWIFVVKPIAAVGNWAGLWGPSPDWSVWLYGIIFIIIGVAASVRFSYQIKVLSVIFFSVNLGLYWMLFLWSEWGPLGEFIVGSIGYTLLIGTAIAVFISASPSSGKPSVSQSERSSQHAVQTDEMAENHPSVGETSTGEASRSATEMQSANKPNPRVSADMSTTPNEPADNDGPDGSQQTNEKQSKEESVSDDENEEDDEPNLF